MIIAVDFDGTCVEHAYPDVGQDVPGAAEVLLELTQSGHLILLNTMRSGVPLAAAVAWFRQKEVFLSGINTNPAQTEWTASNKCEASLYVDDAAFGCPLILPPGFKRRCVDWSVVYDKLLGVKSAYNIAEER